MKNSPSYKMELHKIFGFLLVWVESRFPGRRVGLRGLRKWPLQSPSLTARVFFVGLIQRGSLPIETKNT